MLGERGREKGRKKSGRRGERGIGRETKRSIETHVGEPRLSCPAMVNAFVPIDREINQTLINQL